MDQENGGGGGSGEGMDFMEQYTQGVSAVETILALDRLRQSVAVKELLRNSCGAGVRAAGSTAGSLSGGSVGAAAAAQSQQSQFMRKTVSVPNFSHVSVTLHHSNSIRKKSFFPLH